MELIKANYSALLIFLNREAYNPSNLWSSSNVWPWKITRLLVQIYSAPLLAYGLSSLMLSLKQTWPEVRVVVAATFVFALGVLLASFIHRELFSLTNVATWLWFGGFLLATVILGLLSMSAIRAGGSA